MPNLVLGKLKYPIHIRQFKEAIAIMETIEELESEGMVGKIMYDTIRERLMEKHNVKLSIPLMWELAYVGFLKYTKIFYKCARSGGNYVYSYRWRVNKDPKFSKSVIQASWEEFLKAKKEREEEENNG